VGQRSGVSPEPVAAGLRIWRWRTPSSRTESGLASVVSERCSEGQWRARSRRCCSPLAAASRRRNSRLHARRQQTQRRRRMRARTKRAAAHGRTGPAPGPRVRRPTGSERWYDALVTQPGAIPGAQSSRPQMRPASTSGQCRARPRGSNEVPGCGSARLPGLRSMEMGDRGRWTRTDSLPVITGESGARKDSSSGSPWGRRRRMFRSALPPWSH
jgi:hypothetical protein